VIYSIHIFEDGVGPPLTFDLVRSRPIRCADRGSSDLVRVHASRP